MTAAVTLNGHAEKRLRNSDPLRVVLAAWAPFHAGAEVAAERLAIGLLEQGHEVTVVLATGGVTFERMRAAGLDVRYLPLVLTDRFKLWKYYRAQRRLRQLLMEIQPDIVHANDLPTSQMVGQAAAGLGIPRVCHHRWIFAGDATDWLNKFGAEWHLFVSRALMESLCLASPRLAASNCSVAHDGLPLPANAVAADRAEARRQLALSKDKVIVLFAGQIIERKGISDLLHAWSIMPESCSSTAELVIVGDDLEKSGEYRREMEALAVEMNSPAQFQGYREDVATWITAADVCVVPSHIEPLGNATLEAMAYGRPVIGTRVGGIPEMIVDGETGLIVPPHQPAKLATALESLLSDAELRAKLGRSARQRCEEKFSLTAHASEVVRVYRQTIAQCTCRNS
jgi:glycosyltransferase involved in cell wall biosynthesis